MDELNAWLKTHQNDARISPRVWGDLPEKLRIRLDNLARDEAVRRADVFARDGELDLSRHDAVRQLVNAMALAWTIESSEVIRVVEDYIDELPPAPGGEFQKLADKVFRRRVTASWADIEPVLRKTSLKGIVATVVNDLAIPPQTMLDRGSFLEILQGVYDSWATSHPRESIIDLVETLGVEDRKKKISLQDVKALTDKRGAKTLSWSLELELEVGIAEATADDLIRIVKRYSLIRKREAASAPSSAGLDRLGRSSVSETIQQKEPEPPKPEPVEMIEPVSAPIREVPDEKLERLFQGMQRSGEEERLIKKHKSPEPKVDLETNTRTIIEAEAPEVDLYEDEEEEFAIGVVEEGEAEAPEDDYDFDSDDVFSFAEEVEEEAEEEIVEEDTEWSDIEIGGSVQRESTPEVADDFEIGIPAAEPQEEFTEEEEAAPIRKTPASAPLPSFARRHPVKQEMQTPPPVKPAISKPVVSETPVKPVKKDRFTPLRSGDTHNRIVEEMYGGNEEALETFLDKISRAPDWNRAKQYIANELFRCKVDLNSDLGEEFYVVMKRCLNN